MIALIFILLLLFSASIVSAAVNPNIIIVNPVSGSTVYSENLLVSVKITSPASINIYVAQEFKIVNGEKTAMSLEEYQNNETTVTSSAIGTTDSFTSAANLSFYTKKVENVKPGVYKISVDTVDAEGAVIYTNSSPVEIKAKEDNKAGNEDSEPAQFGPAQFLRNLLKIIFN